MGTSRREVAGPARGGPTALPGAVRVGGLGKAELLQALREHEVRLNRAAELLFADRRFAPPGEARVIGIAAVSVAELGFGEGATYAQLTARAREAGLGECPLELGPYLRLQFPGQPEGAAGGPPMHGRAPPGSITVASPPLDDAEETPKGFYLRRIDGLSWLRGYWASSDHLWRPEAVLVFARGRAAG